MLSNLTLEERERMAYMAGDTKTADLLAEIMELERQLDAATSGDGEFL